jgi:type VI secretion system protein ImpG
MDAHFLQLYERELKHVRAMGGEFAQAYPKVAGRLGLDAFECADPFVERMIEAFAFLTARVHMRFDAAVPELTSHLLEQLYPGYLAPTPSMTVVQLTPSPREGALAKGVSVPRGASLRSRLGRQQTACEYRTAHEVKLWPLTLSDADYSCMPSELIDLDVVAAPAAKAGLRIVLKTTGGALFDELPVERLPLFVRGGPEPANRLYEHLLRGCVGMVVQTTQLDDRRAQVIHGSCTAALGFDDDQALLPSSLRGFEGHRLLHEYFAFPERFMFVELRKLAAALRTFHTDSVELVLLFDAPEPRLEGVVSAEHLALFCTPAINLFPRIADRIHVSERDHEYHVVPDRTRPVDFEVHSLTQVTGHDADGETRPFDPLYTPGASAAGSFSVRRQARFAKDRGPGVRAAFTPSEVFVSLVDGRSGPAAASLRQLSVETLCTNGSLPLQMPVGRGDSDFTEQSGAPIESVRCVAGPTPPRDAAARGETAWALISHLALDFTTIARRDPLAAAASLRQLLMLHGSLADAPTQRQIQGITSLASQSIVRPIPAAGPMTFGRGIELALTCDEAAFEGSSAFLLAAVLERFFAKYATINTFTETVLCTEQRGEVMRWAAKPGRRELV